MHPKVLEREDAPDYEGSGKKHCLKREADNISSHEKRISADAQLVDRARVLLDVQCTHERHDCHDHRPWDKEAELYSAKLFDGYVILDAQG